MTKREYKRLVLGTFPSSGMRAELLEMRKRTRGEDMTTLWALARECARRLGYRIAPAAAAYNTEEDGFTGGETGAWRLSRR